MKNVNVNGKEYKGVSTVELPKTEGGFASFKDEDEIVAPSGTKQITQNGEYDVSAFAQANVQVAGATGNYQAKTATVNGTILPDPGFDALSKVIVNVTGGGGNLPAGIAKMTTGVWSTDVDLFAPSNSNAKIEHGLGVVPDMIYFMCDQHTFDTKSTQGGLYLKNVPTPKNDVTCMTFRAEAQAIGPSFGEATGGYGPFIPEETETSFHFWASSNAYVFKANIPYRWMAIKFAPEA